MMTNLCNCPNCQTNDCPAAAELEALQRGFNAVRDDLAASTDQLIKLRTQNRELRRDNKPWPLKDVLSKLCEAADILLIEKSYDGHGHEAIYAARDAAIELQQALARIKEVEG